MKKGEFFTQSKHENSLEIQRDCSNIEIELVEARVLIRLAWGSLFLCNDQELSFICFISLFLSEFDLGLSSKSR